MAKKQLDEEGKKDSFIIYKEWEMLIKPLSDKDRLMFFDLLMEWDFVNIPQVDSPHLQSIISFIFVKVAENREKYLDKCKTNSEAAKARWDEYKRLKESAMQSDANAYKRIQTHENAMLNENDNESSNENDNEHDNSIPSKEGVGVSAPVPVKNDFDCTAAAREFEALYKKAGKRNAIEREYAQALIRIKERYGYDFSKGHDGIKTSAAAYLEFVKLSGTEIRYMPNPENWLFERMYETNWFEKAKEINNGDSASDQKSKPLIGSSLVDEINRQREERHRRHREEDEQNGK